MHCLLPLLCFSAASAALTDAEFEWLQRTAAGIVSLAREQDPAAPQNVFIHPDGMHVYPGMWMRDFTYSVMGAADLYDLDDMGASVALLKSCQNASGVVAELVEPPGTCIVNSPFDVDGQIGHYHVDDQLFYAMLLVSYSRAIDDCPTFCADVPSLNASLSQVYMQDGLVYILPGDGAYGFVDEMRWEGHESFCSLLMYQAATLSSARFRECGCNGTTDFFDGLAAGVKANLSSILMNNATGMLLAADVTNKLDFVWASLLAVYLNVLTEDQQARIVDHVINYSADIVQQGQFRHLIAPQQWTDFLVVLANNTYQNGAYWATPNSFAIPAIAKFNLTVAEGYLDDAVAAFRGSTNRVHEAINLSLNPVYFGKALYTDSATNTYYAAKVLRHMQKDPNYRPSHYDWL